MNASDYFSKFYPYAKKASEATGISALLILAQSALESGWGEHAPENNFFGIKAGKTWTGAKRAVATHEYIKGVKTPVTDYFRAYSSPEESFMDWANLIKSNSRYAKVISSPDSISAARELQKAGYSTSPIYADSLIVVAHKFDSSAIPTSTYLDSLAKVSSKKVSTPAAMSSILLVAALGLGALILRKVG